MGDEDRRLLLCAAMTAEVLPRGRRLTGPIGIALVVSAAWVAAGHTAEPW